MSNKNHYLHIELNENIIFIITILFFNIINFNYLLVNCVYIYIIIDELFYFFLLNQN